MEGADVGEEPCVVKGEVRGIGDPKENDSGEKCGLILKFPCY